MRNKIKKILLLVVLISLFTISINSYFVNAISSSDLFFSVKELSVSKDKKVEMTINLDKIDYEKFNFKLQSNVSLLNVDVNNENEVNNLSQNNDELSFDFDKSSSNINSVNLNYSIPESLEVGNVITFKATVTSVNPEDEVLELTYNVEIIETQTDNNQNSNDNQNPNQNPDGKTNDNGQKPSNNNNNNNNNNPSKPTNMNNNTKMPSTTTVKKVNVISYGTISNPSTPKVVYNGSDNNYLKSLSISGYKLNKTFKKENLTYFVSVGSNVKSLKITAKSEDSNSKVYINGNSDLKTGMNKILISVVAENGSVKNYRIYVKKA